MKKKIVLDDAFKRFSHDQDKVLPPEETVKRFKDKLETVKLDILQNTVRIDTGRLDIPVYISQCGKAAVDMIGTKKQMGKGATPEQAEASAVMELAERFSFFSFRNDPANFIFRTYNNIGEDALDFRFILESVHDETTPPEIARAVFEKVPMNWTWAYNLTQNQAVMIPFDWFYAINEFNGPSAGNCPEEAICQGICEVVERHVSSIVSRSKLEVPVIDPESAADPAVIELIDKFDRAGVKIYLSDFTLDTGIPTIGVLAYDPETFPEKSEIVWTAGTTPDPQKALCRALTETAQLGGDFNSGSGYVASGLPKFERIEDADYIIRPEGKTGPVSIHSLPNLSDNNIKNEIMNLISALQKNRMEVFVIETTHPQLDIPAFYTIIPGAHFRERAVGADVGMFCTKILFENSHTETALQTLLEFDTLLPDKYYIQFYIGLCHVSFENYETALDYFKDALNNNPAGEDIAGIYSYMGVCLKEMEKYEEALKVLHEGEKFDKERTDIYNLLGYCYFKLRAHEKAISCFEKVIELDPGSAIDYANIGSNYRDMGDIEKAIEYYRMALFFDPELDFARTNLDKLKTQPT